MKLIDAPHLQCAVCLMPITLAGTTAVGSEKAVVVAHEVNAGCPHSGESVTKTLAQLGITVRSLDV